jgi:hypothetical protein
MDRIFTTDEEKMLVQQHKNTRHDAVDRMLEIRAKYSDKFTFPEAAEAMFNEMTGAVMNLKQRKP